MYNIVWVGDTLALECAKYKAARERNIVSLGANHKDLTYKFKSYYL